MWNKIIEIGNTALLKSLDLKSNYQMTNGVSINRCFWWKNLMHLFEAKSSWLQLSTVKYSYLCLHYWNYYIRVRKKLKRKTLLLNSLFQTVSIVLLYMWYHNVSSMYQIWILPLPVTTMCKHQIIDLPLSSSW